MAKSQNQSQTSVSLAEALKQQNVVKAELCRKSFFYFVQEYWGVIIQDTPYFNWHIEYICQEAELIARRLFMYTDANWTQTKERETALYDWLCNISPGSTKSTLLSQMFLVWCWINDPTLRFITACYTQDKANEQAGYTRTILKSEKFKEMFPHIRICPNKDNIMNFRIEYFPISPITGKRERRMGGQRVSCSVGGSVMSIHAHLIIIDDPIDPKGADGSTLLSTEKWMKETIPSRMVDKTKTVMMMVMQRIHEQDPSGLWISQQKQKDKKLRHICLPAVLSDNVRPRKIADYYTEGYMDKVRLGKEALRRQETALGPYGFAGQYMQTPVPASSGMFQPDKLHSINTIDPATIKKSVRYWDKAGSYNTGAYTVGLLMHQIVEGGQTRYVVADIVRGQWEAAQREKIIRQTAERDGIHVEVYIEQEGGSGGKESAQNTVANLAGFIVKVDRPTGNTGGDAKSTRAGPYAGQVNAGNVSLLEGNWNMVYIDEMKYFPNSRYKDQIDASSGAFNVMHKTKQAGTWGTGRLYGRR